MSLRSSAIPGRSPRCIRTASLAANTTYGVTVAGTVTDFSGNPLGADATWSFTTAAPIVTFTDTTSADFSAGSTGANTTVSQIADGEVILAPTVNEEFGGATLPASWTGAPWAAGGTVTVSGGLLTVNGARATTNAAYGPGRSLEFIATFGAAAFQHVGFVADSELESALDLLQHEQHHDDPLRANEGRDDRRPPHPR